MFPPSVSSPADLDPSFAGMAGCLGGWRFYRQSGSDRLKNSQLTTGKIPRISGTGREACADF
jgi:hypothetical protein